MITLNKIKIILKEWFENHKQVRHFYYGDVYGYAAIPDKEYVSVNAEFLESNLSCKFVNHSYRINIGDLVDVNIEGHEDEVISDCMNIAVDFFSYLGLIENFTLLMNSNVQPFSEPTSDRVSGVVFRIVLQVHRQANKCSVPK